MRAVKIRRWVETSECSTVDVRGDIFPCVHALNGGILWFVSKLVNMSDLKIAGCIYPCVVSGVGCSAYFAFKLVKVLGCFSFAGLSKCLARLKIIISWILCQVLPNISSEPPMYFDSNLTYLKHSWVEGEGMEWLDCFWSWFWERWNKGVVWFILPYEQWQYCWSLSVRRVETSWSFISCSQYALPLRVPWVF